MQKLAHSLPFRRDSWCGSTLKALTSPAIRRPVSLKGFPNVFCLEAFLPYSIDSETHMFFSPHMLTISETELHLTADWVRKQYVFFFLGSSCRHGIRYFDGI